MITIVFGRPGAGKTAFLVQDALKYMTFSDDARRLFLDCHRKIKELNDNGGEFTVPVVPPIYSNFPIVSNPGTNAESRSLYIDGFHLGFENDSVQVMSPFPGSRIYLSESQRYYNSRRSKDLPDWVSRFYEEHRHFGLSIMLDVQRPGLIDINIRELIGEAIEVLGMEHKKDKKGLITSSTYHIRVFEDWKAAEAYIAGSRDKNLYEERKVVHQGNVFAAYESYSYFNQFVPTEGRNFSQVFHLQGRNTEEEGVISRIMYRQTAPEGFYPTRGTPRKKESQQDEGT